MTNNDARIDQVLADAAIWCDRLHIIRVNTECDVLEVCPQTLTYMNFIRQTVFQ
ncbi:MAG: hypothetical protein AAGD25_40900 [Cyanobacteria bacterium P01_F01_bin.150]